MLTTEEKVQRLENLLVRVQTNRSRLGAPASPSATQPVPEAVAAPLPPPEEPGPVHRISWTPETGIVRTPAQSVSLDSPVEPEPAVLTVIPEPEPMPEPLRAEPSPKPVAAAPEPETIRESDIRHIDASPQASAPVLSVRGEQPRTWTLHAVLERAWLVGRTDKNTP